MNKTSIPWADYTWNPITGCTNGCDYCYARGIAKRFGGGFPEYEAYDECRAKPGETFPYGFMPTTYEHRLDEPLRLKKPSIIFLGSMGDLFDPAFPDNFRDHIFATVGTTPQHTYMLLTKQPEEMKRYFSEQRDDDGWDWMSEMAWCHQCAGAVSGSGAIPNLWLGVTVTNQADADERIPLLLDTPAAHRFVSVEPMLGPVDLQLLPGGPNGNAVRNALDGALFYTDADYDDGLPALDAVIVGGKTPGKPLHEQHPCNGERVAFKGRVCDRCEWPVPSQLAALRDQCLAAGVPFHYKHGKHNPALDGVVYDWRPEVAR